MQTLAAYRRLYRARLRMALEAIEDHERGWRGPDTGLGGERVARGQHQIEHIMPRRWQVHWALPEGRTAADRDAILDTIGNLTLLTRRLNSKVSNGPWSGQGGKYVALQSHDVFMLNRQLLEQAKDGWDGEHIRARTEQLINVITEIWPVPEGHQSRTERIERRPTRKVELADLMAAGVLEEGATLYARRRRVAERTATVLSDGALDVDGSRYSTPSGASRAVSGISENGWRFRLVDPRSKRSLSDLWREYVDQRDVDVEDDESPDRADAPCALLAGCRLELHHQFGGYPAAVLHIDALGPGPLADLGGVQARSPVRARAAGWPPGSCRRRAGQHPRSGPGHPAAAWACPAFRSISYSAPSSPKRTVPSAALPSRSSMSRVCIF